MSLGQRRLLSSDRALPCDIVRMALKIPLARAEVSMDLIAISRQRQTVEPRLSWAAIFLRAYGIVAEHCSWLRTSYMAWPIPHIYEHTRSIATVAINRQLDSRQRLFWGRVVSPGICSLRHIQEKLDHFTQSPVTEVFSTQLRLASMPSPLRRIVWWIAINVSGQIRERRIGTFSMSTLAGHGVINRDHPTICSSSLTYGPLDWRGHSLVTLIYDHRLFDGVQAAAALNQLDACLHREILAELSQINSAGLQSPHVRQSSHLRKYG